MPINLSDPFGMGFGKQFNTLKIVEAGQPTKEGEIGRDVVEAAAQAISGNTGSDKMLSRSEFNQIRDKMKQDGKLTQTERGFLAHLTHFGSQFKSNSLAEHKLADIESRLRGSAGPSVSDEPEAKADPADFEKLKSEREANQRDVAGKPTPGFVKKLQEIAAGKQANSFTRADFDLNGDQAVDVGDTVYTGKDINRLHLNDAEFSLMDFDKALAAGANRQEVQSGNEIDLAVAGPKSRQTVFDSLPEEFRTREKKDTTQHLIEQFLSHGFNESETRELTIGLLAGGNKANLEGFVQSLGRNQEFAGEFFKLVHQSLDLVQSQDLEVSPLEIGQVIAASTDQAKGFERLHSNLPGPVFEARSRELGRNAIPYMHSGDEAYLLLKDRVQNPGRYEQGNDGLYERLAASVRSGELSIIPGASARGDRVQAAYHEETRDFITTRHLLGVEFNQPPKLENLFTQGEASFRNEALWAMEEISSELYRP